MVIGDQKNYLQPGIFGGDFWNDDFKKIIDLMPEGSDTDQHTKNYMRGIQLQISSQDLDIDQLENFQIYFDELDRRRKTNWREVYPYLSKRIESVLK